MHTGKPDHLRTFDYAGCQRYFLTFCTFERARRFVQADHVREVYTQFLRAAADEQFAVLAYCFMPDHVHLLVEGRAEHADGRAFIKRAKQFSGYFFKKRFGTPLWQRYGYEHVLRDEEDTLSVARYIIENPLRAGLAVHPREYPFLGSDAYSLEQILEAVQMRKTWSG